MSIKTKMLFLGTISLSCSCASEKIKEKKKESNYNQVPIDTISTDSEENSEKEIREGSLSRIKSDLILASEGTISQTSRSNNLKIVSSYNYIINNKKENSFTSDSASMKNIEEDDMLIKANLETRSLNDFKNEFIYETPKKEILIENFQTFTNSQKHKKSKSSISREDLLGLQYDLGDLGDIYKKLKFASEPSTGSSEKPLISKSKLKKQFRVAEIGINTDKYSESGNKIKPSQLEPSPSKIKLNEKEEEIIKLNLEKEELEQQLLDMAIMHSNALEQKGLSLKILQENKESIEYKQKELENNYNEEKEELEKINKKLQDESEKLNSEDIKNNSTIGELNKELKYCQGKIQSYEEQLNALNKKTKEIETEKVKIEQLYQENTKLSKVEISKLKNELVKTEAKNTNLTLEINGLQDENINLKKENKKLLEVQKKLQEITKNLGYEIKNLEQKLQSANITNKELNQEIIKIKDNFAKQINLLKVVFMMKLNQNNKTLKEKIENLNNKHQQEINEINNNYAKTIEEMEKSAKAIKAQLKDQKSATEKKSQEKQALISKNADEIKRLNSKIDELEEQIKTIYNNAYTGENMEYNSEEFIKVLENNELKYSNDAENYESEIHDPSVKKSQKNNLDESVYYAFEEPKENLKEELEHNLEENRKLNEKVSAFLKKEIAFNTQIKKLTQENEILLEGLNKIDRSVNSNMDAEDMVENLNSRVELILKNIEILREEKIILNKSIEALNKSLKYLSIENNDLQTELKDHKSDIRKVNNDKIDYQYLLDETNNKLEGISIHANEQEKKLKKQDAAIKTYDEAFEKVTEIFDTINNLGDNDLLQNFDSNMDNIEYYKEGLKSYKELFEDLQTQIRNLTVDEDE